MATPNQTIPNPFGFNVLSDKDREVQSYYLKAKEFCLVWHNKIKHRRTLYGGEHYAGQRKKKDEVRFNDPTYTNVVDLTVGIMLVNDFDWRALDWKVDLTEERETAKVEKYIIGTLKANEIRHQTNILYDTTLYATRDGTCVLYTTVDPLLYTNSKSVIQVPSKQNPDQTEAAWAFEETPITIRAIDPLNIYVLPGGPSRFRMIFRAERMTLYDVESEYNVTLRQGLGQTKQMKTSQKGDFLDAWWYELEEVQKMDQNGTPVMNDLLGRPETEKHWVVYNAIYFNWEPVFTVRRMEGYKSLPYKLGFYKPVGTEKPELWGESQIDPLIEPVTFLERAINRRMHQIDVFTSLPLFTKLQAGRNIQLDPGLGNILKLLPNEDAGFPKWPGEPPDVMLHINFLTSRIQQSGYNDLMYGTATSRMAGYAISLLADMGRIRLKQPITQLELFWTSWAKDVLDLTRDFAANAYVRVYGTHKGENFVQMVTGMDVEGFMVVCEIKASFPNEEVQRTAMSVQTRGLLSERTIMERYLKIAQPEDEWQRKLDEMIEHDPVVIKYTIMKKLHDLATDKTDPDPVAKMVLVALQTQGLPGQPGRPGEPQNMPPATGLQSPSGQPPPPGQPSNPSAEMLNEMAGMSTQAPTMEGGFTNEEGRK